MIKLVLLSILLFSVSCTSKYDTCIEKEKEDYRQRNPKASYGQVQSRQLEFEMNCSKYKEK